MRLLSLLFIGLLCTCAPAPLWSQQPESPNDPPTFYTDEEGNLHLVGPHALEALQSGPFAAWFAENADETILPETKTKWAKQLKDSEVTIFLGTWCGDSKRWVPRFVTLWEALGLSTDQLTFISLYRDDERYKQGPAGEEKGRRIHRVPTFIFERDGAEFARIVERPRTNLLSDLAQIALGYPAEPNYVAANYLLEAMEKESVDSVRSNLRQHFMAIRRNMNGPSELNTLGYVLLRSGQVDEALLVFYINSFVYKYNPSVLDSYAEALTVKGEFAQALAVYDRILKITPDDERVAGLAAELREKESGEEN